MELSVRNIHIWSNAAILPRATAYLEKLLLTLLLISNLQRNKDMKNTITNHKKIIAGLTAVTIAMTSAFAFAKLEKGTSVGKTESEIRFALEKQNYKVKEIELEDGVYEVEVIFENQEMELEIDPNSGLILEVELEGDDDDDDDDDEKDEKNDS